MACGWPLLVVRRRRRQQGPYNLHKPVIKDMPQEQRARRKQAKVRTHFMAASRRKSLSTPSFSSAVSGVDNVPNVDFPEELAPVEAATRSQSTVSPTFDHTSVAIAYKDEQCCMVHNSLAPQPNTGERQFMCC